MYTSEEEYIHVLTHLLGVAFILISGFVLVSRSDLPKVVEWGLVIYVVTFLAVFLASSLYHSRMMLKHRNQLRKLDHIAIYFFIAGTNTPFLLGFSVSYFSQYFLALMWTLVLLGTAIKWFEWNIPDWLSLVFYLFMGWLGLVTLYLIYTEVSSICIYLIAIGGVLYTIGAYFYRYDYRKWYHSIWHVFVLLAAISHFAAIYWQVAMV